MADVSDEVSAVLHKTGECLAQLTDASGASAGTDTSLGDLYGAFGKTLNRHSNEQCTVAILALAKSGKVCAGAAAPA